MLIGDSFVIILVQNYHVTLFTQFSYNKLPERYLIFMTLMSIIWMQSQTPCKINIYLLKAKGTTQYEFMPKPSFSFKYCLSTIAMFDT